MEIQNNNPNVLTILGCGSSGGVPLAGYPNGGFWGDCNPQNPKNRRKRSSCFVNYNGVKLLVDTSPDLYTQILENDISAIDAVLYTHHHADHTHGIDELRTLFFINGKKTIPVFANTRTLSELEKSFRYLIHPEDPKGIYPKILDLHPITEPFAIHEQKIHVIPQIHGGIESLGFRFGNVAYSTDFNNLSDHAIQQLQGLDIWIVDCVSREGPKPSHSHLELTLKWIDLVKPKQAYLTHMNYTLDYETLCKELPDYIRPAYDGLQITF